MELLIIAFLLLGTLLAFYLIGVPVAFAMGLTVMIIMLSPFWGGIDLSTIWIQLFHGLNDFALLAVPFYLLLGRLMNRTGLTDDLFDFAQALVGHFRGGIAYVNVVASMIFSGMSGVAVADAAGLGRIEYRAMRDRGYSKNLSIGVTGSSALIGPIIPPSVALIIYALLADVSVGRLFVAGVVPGLLLGLSLMVFIYILVRKSEHQKERKFELSGLWDPFKNSFMAFLIPLIIILGILSGFFTATEAGAVAVVYTLILGFSIGDLTPKVLYQELRDSMIETYALLFILAMAALYGFIALRLRVPMLLADFLTGLSDSTLVILLLLALLFLFIGTFMEAVAAMTILIPILIPVMDTFGIDPLHFGIVVVLILMLGALTPPLGIILFVLEQVTDASLEEIIKGIIPFYIPILVVILLCILFPELVLYLPNRFM